MSHHPQKSPPQSIRHFHDRSPIFYKIHALPGLPNAVLKPRNLHIEYSSHIHELKIIIFYSLFFSLRVSLIGLTHFISKCNIIYQCSLRPRLNKVCRSTWHGLVLHRLKVSLSSDGHSAKQIFHLLFFLGSANFFLIFQSGLVILILFCKYFCLYAGMS